ncbi:DUF1289 domain-containing protein [Ferrimonas marina]|uniref:DUF1289 domain-containing protein n=1 Tax=Ferrimonas marina TaxID=299255 RepID=UPI000A5C8CD1|nr:DUF1289 domain-containing protein [Ferrimonas marina]
MSTLSPCVGWCQLDEQERCRGCLRDVDEIRQWRDWDDNQRRAVMEQLPQRRAAQQKE